MSLNRFQSIDHWQTSTTSISLHNWNAFLMMKWLSEFFFSTASPNIKFSALYPFKLNIKNNVVKISTECETFKRQPRIQNGMMLHDQPLQANCVIMQTLTEETIVHAHYLHWSIGNAVFVAQYAVLSHHVEIRFDIFQMWTPH